VVNVERVRCCERKDAISWMPGCMKHFLAEIENVDRDLIFLALVAVADAARFQRMLRSDIAVCRKRDVMLCLAVKHSEMVVIRSSEKHANNTNDNTAVCQSSVNPLESRDKYSATENNTKLVHWPLMGGLLRLVQRGGDWGGP